MLDTARLPAPTARPWRWIDTHGDGAPVPDRQIEQALTALAAAGPGATGSRIYATYHRQARDRGLL
ncbi:hypothetical protein [Prescottella equi]|uniref:hypothetical protein n=1 Tax=Rhodococcus hoagii TaxID=43767 RepID=UPI0007CD97DF|nr:hypothetical protein [Prescottella equi]